MAREGMPCAAGILDLDQPEGPLWDPCTKAQSGGLAPGLLRAPGWRFLVGNVSKAGCEVWDEPTFETRPYDGRGNGQSWLFRTLRLMKAEIQVFIKLNPRGYKPFALCSSQAGPPAPLSISRSPGGSAAWA